MSEYVELHCHSCFSLLDGASTPEALLDRALELQMPSLALTDHDGLYGIVRFAMAARERGLKPICGAEVTLEDGHHLLLLAENREGYGNLCWLISRARLNASKGNARLRLRWLQGRTTGLIALTGCRNGWVASSLLAGQRDQAFAALHRLQQLFGPGHLYVELQRHFHPEDDALVANMAEMANRLGLPIVATNNAHYATRRGHRLHDVLVAIGHNVSLLDARKWLRPNSEYFVKSPTEMETLFSDYPEALENTLRISERCGLELDFRDEALPPLPHESRQTTDSHLGALCYGSMPKLYPSGSEAARRQLAHELQVIRQTKLAGYFLLVWDIVRFARERGIEVRGRGSAANSIVAYLLGITNVDPLAHNLLFERFLSAEVRVMPDIDLDFCSQRREEVIQYLYEKYGESHVAMVCNYVTYRRRSAIRDVGKALALPPDTIEQLSKGLRGVGGRGIEEAAGELLASPEGTSGRTWAQFLTLCREIQGIPRHLSIHVGGMCITRVPLDELVPLENATMPGRVVIQWDKDSVEDAGLIKIDILSLRTLSLLDECVGKFQRTRGHTVDLDALPLDDPAVYAALQRADTIGAFQVESRAQQQALVKMKPRCFADIIVEVALIRPGPLQGNMVHPFFQRRMGLEPVHYFHPSLKPILKETLGVIVFQEQVIRVAMVMGQFTAGEADLLRRAMSRRRSSEEMAAFRQRFVAGASAQGVPEEIAEDVFTKLSGFASYGFCKSHAAAFAKTAYDTLYLRAHYPTEFYCALLNNQPMGFYAPRVLVGDARRHGVRVLPVHVNKSQHKCTIEEGAVRLGFWYVNELGEASIARILGAREHGCYLNLEDFCSRTRLPRRAIENLILAGGMDEWNQDCRKLIWKLGRTRYRADELPLPFGSEKVDLEPMTYGERLIWEYGVTGLSTNGHVMELFREEMKEQGVITSLDLTRTLTGDRVKVAGMVVVRQAPPTAKGFVFLTLEDEWGLMNVIVRPDIFQAQRSIWSNSLVLMAEGRVEQAEGQVNVLATQAWRIR